jgi:hypothetical protein
VSVAIGVLSGCDDSGRERKKQAEADARAEDVLMADPERVGPELERRLRSRLSFQNGVLIAHEIEQFAPLHVMPPSTAWIADCGFTGLSITFGAGTGGDQNGFSVELTTASLSEQQCNNLAPLVGQSLVAIAKGN